MIKENKILSSTCASNGNRIFKENIQEFSVIVSPWNFYYTPVINLEKSAREAKINPWSIATKKPGVRVGVIKDADFSREKKKTGRDQF